MAIYYDITIEMKNSMIVYEGDPEFKMDNVYEVKKDGYNVSKLTMGSHTGTHIDAPKHFFEEKNSVSDIPMEKLIGNAKVFFIDKNFIDYDDIKDLNIGKHDKILFKTLNSTLIEDREFHKDFVTLTRKAAKFLIKREIDMVGIDYMSIEDFRSEDGIVHKILLSNDVVVLEYIDLRKVDPGNYEIIALPLKIKDCDGSPARVILKKSGNNFD